MIDPIPQFYKDYVTATAKLRALAYEPDGENFDTPEQKNLSDEREKLATTIANTVPLSKDGIAAQLRFIDHDSDGLNMTCDLNIIALRNAV